MRASPRARTGACLSGTGGAQATVKGYVTDLLQKLDASSRLEAVVRAYELGLVAPGTERV